MSLSVTTLFTVFFLSLSALAAPTQGTKASAKPEAESSTRIFKKSEGCESEVSAKLGKMAFGDDKEALEESAIETVCEGNSGSAAVGCIKQVSNKRKYMRPMGLATVCSGGAKGEEAHACLEVVSPQTDKWPWAVDACTGIAHQARSCLSIPGSSCSGPNGSQGQRSRHVVY